MTGGDRLLDEDVDRVAVLRVHHHERARIVRGLHRAEERVVVDHDGALVGHEELVRGDSLVGQLRELLEAAAVVQVGDADVEADVDHGLRPLDLLEVVLERLRERRAGRLHAEVDVRRRAAEGGRRRTRGEVVAGDRAAEVHLEVRVRVDRAREDELPCCVDHLVGGHVEGLADQRHRAVVDVDVADVIVGGRHDAAALDQDRHGLEPPLRK